MILVGVVAISAAGAAISKSERTIEPRASGARSPRAPEARSVGGRWHPNAIDTIREFV